MCDDCTDRAWDRVYEREAEIELLRAKVARLEGELATSEDANSANVRALPAEVPEGWSVVNPRYMAQLKASEAKLTKVRAYAEERAAYGVRGRTVHSSRIASDLLAILGEEP